MNNSLFQPGTIGKVHLKNRIMMAPMGTWLPSREGQVTDALIDYYVERARGGAGGIVVEAALLVPDVPQRLSIADDSFLHGLKRLAGALHEAGTTAFLQLHPSKGRFDEKDPVSASQVPTRTYRTGPTGALTRPMEIREIEQMLDSFGRAAFRAKKAGFDGIEVHAGHGYLVADFMSPVINRRTDRYGGSLENRTRLGVEMVKAAKDSAGSDYPFIFRLSVCEQENTLSLEEAIAIARLLEEGGVDAIDVDSGGAETKEWVGAPYYVAPGYNAYYSRQIKKAVKIPVAVAGSIDDPRLAEEIISSGKADFVTLGRALIADPEFPRKAAAGESGRIRRCIACQQCFETILGHGQSLRCSINFAAGREKEAALTPAARPKKVLVIGGGPGGMQAALAARLRGHQVTLWEKSGRLGGQLNIAAAPPAKQRLASFVDYLAARLEEAGVGIRLDRKATVPGVLRYRPDAVIVATGASPIIPDIPGGSGKLVTAHEVLEGAAGTGQRVVIIGGGAVGCETADYLAVLGREVSIVEVLDVIAGDSPIRTRPFLVSRLDRLGVKVFTGVSHEELADEGVLITVSGKKTVLPADTVVCACGTRPENTLYASLRGKLAEVYEVGDCIEPRRIMDAVSEGALAGQRI